MSTPLSARSPTLYAASSASIAKCSCANSRAARGASWAESLRRFPGAPPSAGWPLSALFVPAVHAAGAGARSTPNLPLRALPARLHPGSCFDLITNLLSLPGLGGTGRSWDFSRETPVKRGFHAVAMVLLRRFRRVGMEHKREGGSLIG